MVNNPVYLNFNLKKAKFETAKSRMWTCEYAENTHASLFCSLNLAKVKFTQLNINYT